MPQNEGNLTFLAGEALAAWRHVKIKSGTTTTPPEVEYADAGEYGVGITQIPAASGEPVSVKLFNNSGSFQVEAGTDISKGAAVYAGDDGKVSKTAAGTALGVAKVGASGDGSRMEMVVNPYLATDAALVSLLDTAGLFDAGNVEAALAEVMKGIKTAQYTLMPSLMAEADGTPLAKFADGDSTTPGLAQLASKDLAIRWNNHGTPGPVAVQFVMPQDLDPEANVVVHLLGAIVKVGADEVDSPVLTVGAYFSTPGAAPGADDDCGGESEEFVTAQDDKYQEKTLTILAANVPTPPAVLTLLINPKDGELGTDDFVLLTPWLEVTRKCLTS